MIAELLTRGTIWLAIVAYAIGIGVFAFSRNRPQGLYATRAAWTAACISLIAHFISAFHFYHDWSHESAYSDTARQTEAVVSLNWGGGLFINYALLIAWIVDVGWWWLSGINSYQKRSRLLVMIWHAFLVFIIFNATVVFKTGMVRWIGLVISLFLVISWISIAKQKWAPAYLTSESN
jgi:predicted neutral ceramidase superfamily lipid hydrolase